MDDADECRDCEELRATLEAEREAWRKSRNRMRRTIQGLQERLEEKSE